MRTKKNWWPEPWTISSLLLLLVVGWAYYDKGSANERSDYIAPDIAVRSPSKTLNRIFHEYDVLYHEDTAVRSICNTIRHDLGIDGRKFFTALDFHESGGNGFRIGDTKRKYRAYGRLQMRQTALDDLQKRGEYQNLDDLIGNDRREMANSIKAFHEYVSRYLLRGEKSDINAYLNTWNAGPSGTTSETDYTRSVKAALKQLSS